MIIKVNKRMLIILKYGYNNEIHTTTTTLRLHYNAWLPNIFPV